MSRYKHRIPVSTPPKTKREYLRELVGDKNRWMRPLTAEERALGFLGWHERGYLPHCDLPGLVQFITIRLADSMPAARQGEWEHLLAIENLRERRTKLEEYLDRGVGECWLRDHRIAGLCEEALCFFHLERYELLAWSVMSNHMHVLVHVWRWPLWKMVQSWKHHVQRKARELAPERRLPARRDENDSGEGAPCGSPAFRWQREYWDTFMRDEEQEATAVRYTESNPVKAGLCRVAGDWAFGSARFRDEFRRLAVPGRP